MKNQIVLLISFVVCIGFSYRISAQVENNTGSTDLCRGKYFTEVQGAEFLNSHVPASRKAWEDRSRLIIQQIKEGMDLQNMPAKVASKAVVHIKLDFDGYSIESVYFESLPGFL